MMAQTEFINPLFMTATGNGLLTDGQRATAKTTKKTVGCRIGPNEFLGTGIRPLMQKKLYERSR